MKILKKLLILFLFIFVTSCSTNSVEENLELQSDNFIYSLTGDKSLSTEGYKKLTQTKGVMITCAGSCGCQVEWPIGSNTVTCSCSSCTMTVIIDDKSKKELENFDTNNILKSLFLKDSKKAFDQYILENFKNSFSGINSIEIHYVEKEGGVMIFNFLDSDRIENSVMIRYTRTGTWVISCIGNCGCTPIFDLEAGTASCSCSDCDLIVEQKQ
jgi:hypothetical protein